MNDWHKHPHSEALSLPWGGGFSPRPIGADKLASLIDLGWSDYWIASYFGVKQSKLSGLRAYYGLGRASPRV